MYTIRYTYTYVHTYTYCVTGQFRREFVETYENDVSVSRSEVGCSKEGKTDVSLCDEKITARV